MLDCNPQNVERVLKTMQLYADQLRSDAGCQRGISDGGSSIIEEQIAVYRAGYAHIWPATWLSRIKQLGRNEDPEYKEYLRLKVKFKG